MLNHEIQVDRYRWYECDRPPPESQAIVRVLQADELVLAEVQH
ncbi:MAG TPA: hypothetical protein V6D10_22065 [Trichocoleus sp.]